MTGPLAQLDAPLRLIGGPESAADATDQWIALTVAALLVMVASTALALTLIRRRRTRAAPREFAFRLMARRLGLGSRDRRTVRWLAGRIDAAPVALLISTGALRRATLQAQRDAARNETRNDARQDQSHPPGGATDLKRLLARLEADADEHTDHQQHAPQSAIDTAA